MFINPEKKEMMKKQEEAMKRMIQQYLNKITDDTLEKVFCMNNVILSDYNRFQVKEHSYTHLAINSINSCMRPVIALSYCNICFIKPS